MNRNWHLGARQWLLIAILLIAGCASEPGVKGTLSTQNTNWQGRLSLRVHSLPEQAFSAHFDLQGHPQAGNLRFTTPLGTVLASMQWNANTATLQANGTLQHFESLSALVHHVTGTDLPIANLFAWLQGIDSPAPGWQVDLRDMPSGKLNAQRMAPETPADLKIILDP